MKVFILMLVFLIVSIYIPYTIHEKLTYASIMIAHGKINKVKSEVKSKPVIKVNVSASTPSVAKAKRYALARLGKTQYNCIDAIFQRESRWNPLAKNRTSGAYGIPQALPGTKMAKFGSDWRTNPITQVKWGIYYVNARYGSACKALQHVRSHGWY